jgi:hypothetical protein
MPGGDRLYSMKKTSGPLPDKLDASFVLTIMILLYQSKEIR